MTDRKETKALLWELHNALAQYFIDQLREGEGPIKGSTLEAMRGFLKDNKITLPESDMVRGGDDGGNLDEIMSDLTDLRNLEDPEDVRERAKKEQEDDSKPKLSILQ